MGAGSLPLELMTASSSLEWQNVSRLGYDVLRGRWREPSERPRTRWLLVGSVGLLGPWSKNVPTGMRCEELRHAAYVVFMIMGEKQVVDPAHARAFPAATMRSGVPAVVSGQPVSISSDFPAGVTNRVDWPPSTSMK